MDTKQWTLIPCNYNSPENTQNVSYYMNKDGDRIATIDFGDLPFDLVSEAEDRAKLIINYLNSNED